jgi:hypothetical protein
MFWHKQLQHIAATKGQEAGAENWIVQLFYTKKTD